MLEDYVLQAPLGIPPDLLRPSNQNVAGFFPRKTERRPFAKPLAGADVGRIPGVEGEGAVKTEEERGEDPERILDGSGGGEMVRGTDDTVGQFVGVIDDAAAGDTADHRDAGSPAPVKIEDPGGVLEPSQ